LEDIVSWGERLRGHLSGIDRKSFLANALIQDAVSKCVEAIGEAAGNLDDLDPKLDKSVPGLNLKLARRARDRLSHGYYHVDLEILWNTAVDAIPKTVAAAKRLSIRYGGAGGT
jgi:uncharacterized protein with HEPN domain